MSIPATTSLERGENVVAAADVLEPQRGYLAGEGLQADLEDRHAGAGLEMLGAQHPAADHAEGALRRSPQVHGGAAVLPVPGKVLEQVAQGLDAQPLERVGAPRADPF